MLTASEVAKELGIHIDTVRRMPESALPVYRKRGGHRRYKMYEFFFKQLGVEVICVERVLPKSFEAELVEDMLALIASFSAKIYGKRSHQNRKKKEAAESGNDIESAQDTAVPE